MMWDLARGRLTCGGCSGAIRVGEPVAYLTRARLLRCAPCVKRHLDEMPPKELYDVVVVPPPAPTFVRITRAELERALPFDVKAAQVGEQ